MKNKVQLFKKNSTFNNILFYFLIFIILFLSVGYASMNTTFNIKGKGYFRVSDWIRITSFDISSTTGGTENYSSKYSKNELISSINLPSNSSITYNFTIENFSEKYGYIKNITNTEYSNNGISYQITGCNINDTLDPHQVLNCTITFTNNGDSSNLASIILFEFDELISSDANLIDLSVLNYSLSPPFDQDEDEYSVDVEETEITIVATTSSDKATVTGDGIVPVSWGVSRKEVVVTAEDNTVNRYYIDVNNIRPTAPVISIDSNDYTNDLHTVSITTAGTALSDVDYYEYYISNTSTTPLESVTVSGMTNGSQDITTDGINYIFYRTVSKHGNRSIWSNGVESKIDTNPPNPIINASESYAGSTATITFNVTSTDGESGMDYSEIYYKKSTDNNYTKLNSTTMTGTAGTTYNYYVISYDRVGNYAQSTAKNITLKNYGENETCGYNYSDFTSTTTNDVASCTPVAQTDDCLTYTTCPLGNWSSPTTTTKVESCTNNPKTTNGLTARECTLDSNWTVVSTENVNSCSTSSSTTLKVECPTNSWSTSKSQTNNCTASGSTSSNTSYVSCSENGWGTGKVDYTTSCTSSTGNTTKVTCESGYYKHSCTNGILTYDKNPTYPSSAASSCKNTSGYKKKTTYTRSYKYTKTTGTRASKYKKTTSKKYYTQKDYTRLYNKTVYTRTRTVKTCWY